MPETRLKQFLYESSTWKRVLSFISDENIHLKNRLAQILKEKFNDDLLSEIEKFQSNFIKEDALIGLLRNDILEFDKLVEKDFFADDKIATTVENKLEKLRHNIKIAESQFAELKTEFNNYLSHNL